MLFNKSGHKQSSEELDEAESRTSIAVVPLAIPLVAGPGTMATVLVAAQQHPSVLSKIEISIVAVVLLLAARTPAAAWHMRMARSTWARWMRR
jgi:multiple antibiotic resistance protein